MQKPDTPSDRWYVYILQCSDNTLYTGITVDLDRRVQEHNQDNRLGARYTRARRPVSLVYRESCSSRSAAAQREAAIRKMPRDKKQALIMSGSTGNQGRRA
jgi:putative endonuclease